MLSKIFRFFRFLWRYFNRRNFQRDDFLTSDQNRIKRLQNGPDPMILNFMTPDSQTRRISDERNELQKLCNSFFSQKNDHEPFRTYFKTFTNPDNLESLKVLVSQKPLCVYAVYSGDDRNGAIISKYGLQKSKADITQLEKDFTVIPILFSGKDKLENKIGKTKKKIGTDVGVLWFTAHGDPTGFAKFDTTEDPELLRIAGISSSTQIILRACSTAGGKDIKNSVAYKLAETNQCEVFAAEGLINHMFLKQTGRDEQGKTKVISVGAGRYENNWREFSNTKVRKIKCIGEKNITQM